MYIIFKIVNKIKFPIIFQYKTMATTVEASQSLIQSETRHYQEVVTETRQVKKKTKSRRHKDEGSISVVGNLK